MAYTNIDDPSAYFQATTYTGTNSSGNAITNSGNSDLQPDMVWIKVRTYDNPHIIQDTSRGFAGNGEINLLQSASTSQELTNGGFESFDSNGFTVGGTNPTSRAYNGSTDNYIAWQWKANGGTTVSNTDGSTTSTVQVNQDAGFSLVNYTVGIAGGNHSVGHGLGVAPNFILIKCRGAAQDWLVYHSSLGSGNYIKLNTTAGSVAYADSFGDGVTSSVFGYNYAGTSIANQPYIAYCFAEKQGYSKFGSYIGNGNANGPFIYTGFKPAWIMLKDTQSSGDNWQIIDTKRDPHNPQLKYVQADNSAAEGNFTFVDILSNGFKFRSTYSVGPNVNGHKTIYMAFAENPFVTSTGIPTTAR